VLSYAPNAADVVLPRVFGAQACGLYIEVGGGPTTRSVTQRFYDRGWRGINLSGDPAEHARLCEARPRDVNLRWVQSDGLAGTSPALSEVCARHAPGAIDFLAIAGERDAGPVIRGGDWARYRPRIVLAAAAEADSPAACPWEPVLLAAGYRLARFDGRARIYVRAEDAALLRRLPAIAAGGPCASDVPQSTAAARDDAGRGQYVAELELQVREWERYATDVEQKLDGCQAWTKALERKVRRLEEHLGLLPDTLPPPPVGYTREAFVRFLYAALFNRSDATPSHVAHWTSRLRDGATMLELFDAFLATAEGHHRFWTNSYFQRYFRPHPPAVAFADVPELAVHLGVVKVLDVGAMPVADGADVYAPLTGSPHCQVVAFEPRAAARHARRRRDRGAIVHSHVVGDGAPGTFHRTADGAASSLYRPDRAQRADFAELRDTGRVVAADRVPTVRLDDVDDCRGAAFCRLDVAGAEREVLRGAPRLLRDLLVLHVETAFAPVHEHQALFGDVDAELRAAGFELYAFPRLDHHRYGDGHSPDGGRGSRLLRGAAVFVPTRERMLALPVERALPLCWIMHELYRAYDLCRWLLARRDADASTTALGPAYERVLASRPR
jgi:FkbM family methyltransferase